MFLGSHSHGSSFSTAASHTLLTTHTQLNRQLFFHQSHVSLVYYLYWVECFAVMLRYINEISPQNVWLCVTFSH